MIGVELVADKETRQHLSAPHFVEIWEMCKDMGVLFGRGGLNANVSTFIPNKKDKSFETTYQHSLAFEWDICSIVSQEKNSLRKYS